MKKVVYIAMNSKYFKFRESVSKFVFEQGAIPLNSLMVYGYYLYGMVPKDIVIEAYRTIVQKCDEVWAFGEISDGVKEAMLIAKKKNMRIRYFDIMKFPEIVELPEDLIVWEEGVKVGR